MKRQKRDRLIRAESRGYNAGVSGQSREACPYGAINARERWFTGWRAARTDVCDGLIK